MRIPISPHKPPLEDRYEILGELDRGGPRRILRARQRATSQQVAIEFLSPFGGSEASRARELARFDREARRCAVLSHTNIVALVDWGQTAAAEVYCVYAHVPGETLEQVLARDGALGVRESIRLMTQVLDGLACAHSRGIVHRALEPARLLLSGTGARRNALILGFGLGGVGAGPSGPKRARGEGTLLSPYAAPEQRAGQPPSPHSDLYAWALCFLACLTAQPAEPLPPGATAALPPWLRAHRLGALLDAVTVADPEKRDASIPALIEALEAVEGSDDLPVAPALRAPGHPPPLSDRGERRHLTVMFCDLVGSSELSQRLDPEAYRRVIQAYQARCAAVIERHEGHVAQYLGDGILVYFGYPRAHEDDAERAVRSGRSILRELEALNPQLEAEHGVRLSVRIGIHTGLVVVDEMGVGERRETLALGETPNIASRLGAVAEADSVVVSDATLRLVPGLFLVEDQGSRTLKGISHGIHVYRVTRASGVSSRLDRAPRLTPFVGRTHELALLLECFERAKAGRGQVLLIGGEAGIGKSRLLHRLREQLRLTPHTWLECPASPYTVKSAFHPVISLAERLLFSRNDEAPEAKLARLRRGLELMGLDLAETLPLLASLLSLPLPAGFLPLESSPQIQRHKTMETLLTWVLTLGERQPVLLVVEDLHWLDPTTLEWLGLLIERCSSVGLLLLLTFRPEFQPPWPNRRHVWPITLRRLEAPEARALALEAASAVPVPAELVDQIAARSDGVPLFAEELARSLVEAGPLGSRRTADPHRRPEIPETLHDSLMARLDRLGPGKEVAQLGAALGRDFSYALLEAVAPMKDRTLREGLKSLVAAELLYQRGQPPEASYTFKHALVQDAAYESLLRSQRRELHGRIVQALEQRFPEHIAREPEVVARHYEEVGRTAEAVAHYLEAGRRATQRFAHSEAVAHLRWALELLASLPESEARDLREIDLRVAVASPLAALRGYDDPEALHSCERLEQLCRAIATGPRRLPGLLGLMLYHLNRGHLLSARISAEALLADAEPLGVTPLLVAGHMIKGTASLSTASVSEACHHLRKAIELARAAELKPPTGPFEVDSLSIAHCTLAIGLVVSGQPQSAVRASELGLRRARELAHPRTQGSALANCAMAFHLLEDPARTGALAAECLAVLAGRGFHTIESSARVLSSWARARQGDPHGIADLEGALRFADGCGTVGGIVQFYFAALDVYARAGRFEEAFRAYEQGSAAIERTGEWVGFEAQLPTLRARLLLESGSGSPQQAAELLLRSLELWRGSHSLWLALDSAIQLGRIAREAGVSGEARAHLVDLVGRFREGLEIPRLREARALIQQLAGPHPGSGP